MTNAQKKPLGRSLNKIAQKRSADAIELLTKGLPVTVKEIHSSNTGNSNTIVVVSFNVKTNVFTLPDVTIPVFGPEYIRYPIQVGDKGVAIPMDVLLGGITGLGSGTADLAMLPGNLQALVFLPIGSKNFTDTDDQNALVMYGPNGVILRDKGNNCSIKLDQNNVTVTGKTQITLQVGSKSIVITSSNITIDGIVWDTHEHTGVQTGSSKTGGPTGP